MRCCRQNDRNDVACKALNLPLAQPFEVFKHAFCSTALCSYKRSLAYCKSVPVVQVITSDVFSMHKSGCVQAFFLSAYATLGERVSNSCLTALTACALPLLPRFNAQDLSNTAWALAKMDISEPVCSLDLPMLP